MKLLPVTMIKRGRRDNANPLIEFKCQSRTVIPFGYTFTATMQERLSLRTERPELVWDGEKGRGPSWIDNDTAEEFSAADNGHVDVLIHVWVDLGLCGESERVVSMAHSGGSVKRKHFNQDDVGGWFLILFLFYSSSTFSSFFAISTRGSFARSLANRMLLIVNYVLTRLTTRIRLDKISACGGWISAWALLICQTFDVLTFGKILIHDPLVRSSFNLLREKYTG